jgi:hypothetical protein
MTESDDRGRRRDPGYPGDTGDQLQPGEAADLLSIGLLVFFVAILLVVAALLAVPLVL